MIQSLKILAIALAAFALSACPFDDDDDPAPTAQLRVLHGSPDAPAVDVLVNGSAVLEGVPYKAASGYLNVPTGGFDVQVNAAGTSTTALALDDVQLLADTPYTVIAANAVANIEAIVLEDSATAPASGNVLVRVVHATATVPAVDVYVTAPDATLDGVNPAVPAAAYKDASGFLEIPGGDYRIRVTAANDAQVLFDSGSVSLPAGAQLTVVALPSENNIAPIDLVALTGNTDAPTIEINDNRAQLRAAHLSPDAPNVDIYVDDTPVLTNVPYKAISDYLLVQSGDHLIEITASGDTTPVLTINQQLAARTSTTAAAVDFVASLSALALEDNLSTPAAGNAHVRVIHATPDAPAVDVLVDGNEVLTNVAFTDFSGYLPLSAGMHNVKVNVTGTPNSVIDADLNLADGAIYSIFAVKMGNAIEALVQQDN